MDAGLGGACTAPRKGLVLGCLCVGLFMAMLDNLVVTTALPAIGRGLNAGTAGLQWVVEAYSLVYASLLLTGGTLGDRWGRRRVYLLGLALFTAGSAGCALAGSLPALVAGRACQAVGAALLTPGTLSILRHVFTGERERARAIGVWSGVSGAGLTLGPALGGPLVDHFGWAAAFWINVPIGVGGLLFAVRVLPVLPRTRVRTDPAGQATVVMGLAALVYALVEGPVRGWGDPLVLGATAGAVVLLTVFAVLELRVAEPMVDVRLLAGRTAGVAAFAGFAVSFGFFGLGVFLSMYLQYVLGWSPTAAGLAMLPATAFTGAAAVVAGRVCGRVGSRLPLAAGLVLVAVGLAGFTRYGTGARFVEFGWLLPVIGTGLGLTFTPISVAVLGAVPAARAGMASAAVNMVREVGGVAGVAVLGAVLTSRFTASVHVALPPSQAAAVSHAVTSGAALATAPGPVRAVTDRAFVTGMHAAMWTGTALLAATAALVLTTMRGGRDGAAG
ncbi:MFS transporter [Streptantibioticus parmotrematis]|uniref:MFS transporter n=1 Tax=Streptantibioticus parmotrematis TaxID=2873249 RepID=UPI0033F2256B